MDSLWTRSVPCNTLGASAGFDRPKNAHDAGLKPGLAGGAVVFLTWPLQIGSLWPFVHFDKVQRLLKKPQSCGRISKNSQKVQPALEISAIAITTHLNLACTELFVAIIDMLVKGHTFSAENRSDASSSIRLHQCMMSHTGTVYSSQRGLLGKHKASLYRFIVLVAACCLQHQYTKIHRYLMFPP